MTIVYCSWETGDDTLGDGSPGNPYKTITKASTSRSPGDEVRVAKSPEPTSLTGTIGMTLNSTAVVGVGTLFTTELVIGDFIKGPDGMWYEVITITDNTNAVLYKKYPGETSSEYSSQKLGVTNTGAAASGNTQVQIVSSSGNSSNYLYISGGWDLSTQTQTGQTFFKQMHGTFATRNGYGIYIYNKSYIDISRLHFLRYSVGIKLYLASNYNVFNSPICCSNITGISFEGNISEPRYNTIISPICNSNNGNGISIVVLNNDLYTVINNPICNSNNGNGINLQSARYNNITSPICTLNSQNGIYLISGANYNTITSPLCTYNGGSSYNGIQCDGSNNIINSPVCNYNNNGISFGGAYNNICRNAICNYNNYAGITFGTSGNTNSIISPTCNFNGTYGISYSDVSNNILTFPICNSNGTTGIRYNSSNNNTCISPISNSNKYGLSFSKASNNTIYGTLSTTGNTIASIFIDNIAYNYIVKANISELLPVSGFSNRKDERIIINDNGGGYSCIYTDNGTIISQNATAGGSGKEWVLGPTNALRNFYYPLWIPIARFAVASSGKVTSKVYFKKSGIGVAGALRCRYGQVEWTDAAEDIIVNCPDNTNRNQVTLEFTPTETGVVEIEALAWYISAIDQNVIIDDIEITQV